VISQAAAPLAVAAAAFLAVLLWRVRPRWPWRPQNRELARALHEARVRVAAARDGPERARALCDAADLVGRRAALLGGWSRVAVLFGRAVRADPRSPAVVTRGIAALAERPRELESLLWRHLALAPWTEAPDAVRASLRALRSLYEGPIRRSARARALERAEEVLRECTEGTRAR
jgi:hypothetical protein